MDQWVFTARVSAAVTGGICFYEPLLQVDFALIARTVVFSTHRQEIKSAGLWIDGSKFTCDSEPLVIV